MCPITVETSDHHDVAWPMNEDLKLCPIAHPIWRPDILVSLESTINSLDTELRQLSLDIHDHPELGFKEYHAHDVLTKFMRERGFEVTEHYILPTAWTATFKHGQGGRTLGVNSEMDALPGMGHACGHNLIAIAGVAVACAVKTALIRHNIPGTIVLLGTPAEEGGGGKNILLEAGAYNVMDACLMCHPCPGPNSSCSLGSTLAVQNIVVEFAGHSAHAGLSPWEGQNALDAAVIAYNSISALRQQLHPTVRVHGIFHGHDWSPNIIPDNSKMTWLVRAPNWSLVQDVVKRVIPCFKAAALAANCRVTIESDDKEAYYELRQNPALADEFESIFSAKYGTMFDANFGASTDFGNVTFALPGIHPMFAIPTEPDGGNHTPAFTKSAATPEAHKACLNTSKAVAATGMRVLVDDNFFVKVQSTFNEQNK